jgi:hypothetical protein
MRNFFHLHKCRTCYDCTENKNTELLFSFQLYTVHISVECGQALFCLHFERYEPALIVFSFQPSATKSSHRDRQSPNVLVRFKRFTRVSWPSRLSFLFHPGS